MGKKGPKAVPNAIKSILGRKEKGISTTRKGHGVSPVKRNNYSKKM